MLDDLKIFKLLWRMTAALPNGVQWGTWNTRWSSGLTVSSLWLARGEGQAQTASDCNSVPHKVKVKSRIYLPP